MVEQYKNGNIHIKFELDEIEDLKAGRVALMDAIDESLFWVDTYFVGDPWCAGNYEIGYTLYNYNCDKCYNLLYRDIEKLLEGKTLILRAFEPDAETREMIA
jgi:hypothetical protein